MNKRDTSQPDGSYEMINHNLVDGAPAARFAARLQQLIESGDGLDAVSHT
jgi:hypothetical protein